MSLFDSTSFLFQRKNLSLSSRKIYCLKLFHHKRVNFLMYICYKYSMSTDILRATQSNIQIYKLYCRFCDTLPWQVNSDLMFHLNYVCTGLHRQDTLGNLFWKKTNPISLHFSKEMALASTYKPKNPEH